MEHNQANKQDMQKSSVNLVTKGKSSKCARDFEHWKKTVVKKHHYTLKNLPKHPHCSHATSKFNYSALTMQDIC